jgi:hypothetical protein
MGLASHGHTVPTSADDDGTVPKRVCKTRPHKGE